MINKLCSSFYDMLYRMDKKNGSVGSYEGEHAPYCGHHYCGHSGKYTNSHYNEGMGGCEGRLGPIWVSKNSEEYDWDWRIILWKKPPVVWRKKICDGVYNEVTFHGFIGFRKGFKRKKWFTSLVPFAPPVTGAWHFLGLRFTKTAVRRVVTVIVLMLMTTGAFSQTIERDADGNFRAVSKSRTPPKETTYTFTDSKGRKYPVLMTEAGRFFVIKTSAKTGKEYRYYLDKKPTAKK